MSTLEARYTLREDIAPFIPTGGADDRSLATIPQNREENRSGWQDVIDRYLVEWGRTMADLEDDGLIPPTRQAIDLASHLAMLFRDRGTPPPMRVVPNGDGGICFERWHGECFQTIEIRADMSVELITYKDAQLVSRHRLDE